VMSTGTPPEPPFVSVVVPVYNDAGRIWQCIEALLNQSYPHDRYEILVVDNGSTDNTREVIAKYPVTLLVEDKKQSSFAARNCGLAQARGTIIATTDSDCTPAPAWLAEGVRPIVEQQADLVGGNVRFVFSSHPTAAEIYDSLTNMQMEHGIRTRGVAKTANLFARAELFEQLGPFDDTVRSGGDVRWTSNATEHGFRLVYVAKAEVAHPTRNLRELLRKQYRVGLGQRSIPVRNRPGANYLQQWSQRWGVLGRAYFWVRELGPDSPRWLRQVMGSRQLPVSGPTFIRVLLVGWLARLTTRVARATPKLNAGLFGGRRG